LLELEQQQRTQFTRIVQIQQELDEIKKLLKNMVRR